jgi:glycosyltransferase involved in cell wall biosynthesis
MARAALRGRNLKMTISVVMPVKNGARYIAEAIRSALDQGALVREIIVVDDGSIDGTVAVVRAIDDPRITIVPNRTRGLPAGRNTGAALCTSEWLHFLDSDDRMQPGAYAKLLAAAKDAPASAVVYGDYERVDENGGPLGSRRLLRARRKPSGFILPKILRGNFMIVGAQLVRRSDFERVGGFEESLPYCEDWHMWCRLAAVADFTHAHGLHALDYRMHGASMMHAKPRPFSDFLPAVDAVFADPFVAKRMSHEELAALRPTAEASLMAYTATESIRLRAYANAAASAFRAMLRAPSQTPKLAARMVGTVLGL